ncbi:MAG: hypothetical protein ABI890_10070 [Lapillicoccus sp.]
MTLHLPPERSLPDADAVLRRVLGAAVAPERGPRRVVRSRWAPVMAAVVVALIAVSAVALLGGRRSSPLPPPASTGSGQSSPVVISADGTRTWPEADVVLEPAGDRRPTLSSSAALAAYCAREECSSRGTAQVDLGLGTTRGSGTARPDGSISPLVDRALVYALQWETTTCSPSHTPGPPSSTPLPPPLPSSTCVGVALVDADTGATLFEFRLGTSTSSYPSSGTVGPVPPLADPPRPAPR